MPDRSNEQLIRDLLVRAGDAGVCSGTLIRVHHIERAAARIHRLKTRDGLRIRSEWCDDERHHHDVRRARYVLEREEA